MSAFLMRPSCAGDFDAMMDLAELSGPGFTSLPVNDDLIRSRLEKSEKAFAGDLEQPEYGKYLMVMEDHHSGDVVGCSAVKAG
ncbi:MAG: arginine N-succinyltransferase, partial [Pseudomonadota bacterium]